MFLEWLVQCLEHTINTERTVATSVTEATLSPLVI